MQTVVIQITEASNGSGFAVKLLADKGDPLKLASVPGAVATIPASLDPDSNVVGHDGNDLTVADVLTQYESEPDPSPAYAPIGEFLYRLVVRGKVESAWTKLRAAGPVRTIIDIAPGPKLQQLHRLPWELMFDPVAQSHVFTDATSTILRGEAKPIPDLKAQGLAFNDDDWPLRVLVVFGADTDAAGGAGGGIGASAELDALETLFAESRFDVEYEVLEHPSRQVIIDKLRDVEPHILHFIGHAEAGAKPQDHKLLIYGPGGDPDVAGKGYDPWPLFDIRTDLQKVPLRLAVLNGCRTAGAAAGGAPATKAPPFENIAESLLQRGTLGVIGMRGDIPGDVAAEFSKALYKSLVKGAAVDEAVQTARLALTQLPKKPSYIDRKDWSFPMLRTRVLPDLVLPQRRQGGAGQKFSARPERFVGQVGSRRLVRQRVRPKLEDAKPAKPPKNGGAIENIPHLVAIVGDAGTGKTHLVKWCAELCAERDLHIAYVRFDGDETIDMLETLRWIRDGKRPPKVGPIPIAADSPLPQSAFRRFTMKLNARMKDDLNVEGLAQPTTDVMDNGVPLIVGASPDLAFVEETFNDFRLALEEAAKARPVVLILDQLELVETTTRSGPIAKYLLSPIARGKVAGVCAVAVVRATDFPAIQTSLVNAAAPVTVVDVSYFKRGEFSRITRHLCQQWSPAMYKKVQGPALENLLKDFGEADRWKGELLQRVDGLCALYKR